MDLSRTQRCSRGMRQEVKSSTLCTVQCQSEIKMKNVMSLLDYAPLDEINEDYDDHGGLIAIGKDDYNHDGLVDLNNDNDSLVNLNNDNDCLVGLNRDGLIGFECDVLVGVLVSDLSDSTAMGGMPSLPEPDPVRYFLMNHRLFPALQQLGIRNVMSFVPFATRAKSLDEVEIIIIQHFPPRKDDIKYQGIFHSNRDDRMQAGMLFCLQWAMPSITLIRTS